MTRNSVEKCFAVWNVIQNVLLTLKPNIYCFCLENHCQHGFVLLEIFAYPSNKRIIYGPELNLQISKSVYSLTCSYKKEIFLVKSFSEQVAAKGNFLEST